MNNALIYSSGFDGHRQVYVFVLSHILCELKFNIFIAGNLKEKITTSIYIEKLKKNDRVTMIDTSSYAQGGLEISAIEIIELQNKYNIELTVFAEADHHIPLFNEQINSRSNRLHGKTIGIFLRPFYYYEKLSFLDKLRYVKHFKSRWKSDERMFHGFLLKHYRLLDSALYIDENFVAHHKSTQWLPDVFQQFAETLVSNEYLEQRIWIDKLNEFTEKNKGLFIFLYFGTAQKRRGYDLLLKMAIEQNACFVHCGLRDDREKYDYDVDEFRKILYDNKRMMETDQYISDPVCIEHFFKSVSHLVLPYRKFYGSSGVMLQAFTYGIPVLVPEVGIIGYRVKRHNLGLTYKGDFNSLIEQYKKFKEISKNSFADSINLYMHQQSVTNLKEVLVKTMKV
jgi:hypothetical protein